MYGSLVAVKLTLQVRVYVHSAFSASACLDPGWHASPLPAARTFAWELWKGERNQPVDANLRPPVDHSFGNRSGAFAIASSGLGATRDEASLVSDEIPRTSPQCDFEFWYYMVGVLLLVILLCPLSLLNTVSVCGGVPLRPYE